MQFALALRASALLLFDDGFFAEVVEEGFDGGLAGLLHQVADDDLPDVLERADG